MLINWYYYSFQRKKGHRAADEACWMVMATVAEGELFGEEVVTT